MPHRLTRAKLLQNDAFLRRLAATGNVRLAAAEAGVSYRTMQRRRAAHGVLRQRWDAALAVAAARLGARDLGEGDAAPAATQGTGRAGAPRTAGGEATLVRRRDGTLQVRRAHPGRLTRAAEQQFLLALAATCNVRLAAAAVGTQTTHFYRRRAQSTAFAREWRIALEEGYGRLELALLEAGEPGGDTLAEWAHNDRPALPPMSVPQALQLLYLHQKEARLKGEPRHLRRRRSESPAAHEARLLAIGEAAREEQRDRFRIAEAVRHARGEPTRLPLAVPVLLPDLAQVTGWSRAAGKGEPAEEAGRRALFGGWRMEHMRAQIAAAEAARDAAWAAAMAKRAAAARAERDRYERGT